MCCGYRPNQRCREALQMEIERKSATPGWMLNKQMPEYEQWGHLREALAHQQRLEQNFTRMTQTMQSNNTDVPPSLRDSLNEARNDIEGLKSFFSSFLCPTFYNEAQPQPDESIAHRVFDVPELLELILLELPIPDIMNFQQVNRTARDAINASPMLQRALSLRADSADSPLRAPFSDLYSTFTGGFSCGHTTRYRRQPRRLSLASDEMPVAAEFVSLGSRLPVIGTRWRRMFVLQPPIHEMSATVSCCTISRTRMDPQIITSETGITIGDLHDAAQKLWNEHRQCTNAGMLQHDEDGLVKVQVTFTTKVKLGPNEPFLLERQKRAARAAARSEEVQERNALVQAYIVYKRAGKYQI